MNSQTSLVAQQTRLSEWAEQITDCQNRPPGMKVEEWCHLHGIKKNSYYWRLRKVREAVLEEIESTPSFVELPAIRTEVPAMDPKIVAVLKGANHLTLEITDQASNSFISALLGVMTNAQ